MSPQSTQSGEQARFFFIFTAITCLLSLGPLFLTSREMWDGVISSYALAINDDSITYGWLVDSNWYLTYGLVEGFQWLERIAGIPVWVSLKLWNSSMILLIAYETAILAKNLLQLPVALARWCFPLVVSFPIWYVLFSYTPMSAHLLCAWMGLIGYRFLQDPKNRIAKFFAGISVIFSFQLASNCIFLPMLAFSHWMLIADRRSERLRVIWFVVAASVTVFVATRVAWPPIGAYVGYNTIRNPAQTSVFHYLKYIAMFGSWAILIVPALVSTLLIKRLSRDVDSHDACTSPVAFSGYKRLKQGVALFCLLGAASAAYIAVGLGSPLFVLNVDGPLSFSASLARSPDGSRLGVWYGGWGTRQLILFLIPLCLATVWLVDLFTPKWNPQSKGTDKTLRNASLALCISVMFNLIWLLPGHWAKLTRHAEEQVIINWLKVNPAPPPGKLDIILPASIDYISLVYEANYLLFQALGRDNWAALIFPGRPELAQSAHKLRQDLLSTPESKRNLMAGQNLMKGYDWTRKCLSSVTLILPKLSPIDILWSATHSPATLSAATATRLSSDCPDASPPWRN